MKLNPPRSPRRRRVLVRALAAGLVLLLTILLLELGSGVAYRLMFHAPFSRSTLQRELLPPQALSSTNSQIAAAEPPLIRNHILHPYLGFVGQPGTYVAEPEFSRNGESATINQFGLLGADPLVKRRADAVNICVLGGSMAMNFYLDSRATLARELQQNPAFQGKQINIVPAAFTGWKEPQQLLALAYLLSQGAEYDFVVNLDGFNEVALTFGENRPGGVYPFYPRLWSLYASRFLLPDEVLSQFARVVELKQKAKARREFFASSFCRRSNFCLLLWAVLNRRAHHEIAVAEAALQQRMGERLNTRSVENSGPRDFGPEDPGQFFEKMAEQWETCSRQLDALSKASGALYLHFLQPNQYVPDSKQLTRQEMETAYNRNPEYAYRIAVEQGYPHLIAHGRQLREAGVNFVDLTMLFKGVPDSLYEDPCCHVNRHGNDLLAQRIAQAIVAARQRPGS